MRWQGHIVVSLLFLAGCSGAIALADAPNPADTSSEDTFAVSYEKNSVEECGHACRVERLDIDLH